MDYTDLEPSATLTGTGSEMILVLEPKSFKPFKSKDEYMYAMKEDLADWFTCLYSSCITVDNFFEVLETGVELCKHANSVRKFALEQQEQVGTKPQLTRHIPNGEIQYRKEVKAQTFHARDNVSNFISWCRDIGVPEVLRFETDDLVLRKNERSVVLCLLEVARVGAKLGMLAPTIVQMEEEIDAELAGEPPPPMKQIITCDLKSLDEMTDHPVNFKVRELVGKCTCPSQFPIIKVGEGKYKIGDSQTLIFVRILRNHVMVRVGGGWDTLENYLDKHDPCRCHFKGHRGNTSNQSAAIKRATVRRASAPSGQILADHINQRSPKKDPLSTTGGKYIAATPPRCESPVSGRSSKRSSGQTSQYSSSENLHRTPCQSPAKHSKMLPPATVGGKTPTSPAKRAASPASTSSLPSSSHRSSASSSLSASSEKLNSSESRSSGGKLDMDQISTMTLEQFKNLLNNQLITTAREQTAAESSETPPRQKGKGAASSSSNKLQNPSTKNILLPNSQGRGGSKQHPAVRSAEHSPDITRRTQSPSPSLAGPTREASDREGCGDGVKPRSKKSGLSFLPRPSTQPAAQSNGESKIPMKKRPGATTAAQITRQATVPPCEVRTQRSLPSTPKQEQRYNRTLAPHKSMDNTTKQISSIAKRPAIVQRATMQAPKLQPQSKIETRRSSTPGLRELQVYSESGNANLTDDTQSSADEENEGLKTPTPNRRLMPNTQSGLPYRSSSTQSLSLAVKGDIEIEEPPRPTSHPTGYAERWRRNKRSTSAIRPNAASSSPDTITVSRTQGGGHSVVLGKGHELRAGITSTGQETSRRDPSRDTYEAAVRRARSITRNSRIARSQSADRFSYRQRSSSTSSVEDNDQTYIPKDSEQKRRLKELANKFYNSERCSGLSYDRDMRSRRGGSVTPNSIDIYDCDLSSRPLEEIKAALNPVNGIVPPVSDPNELEAPPEDPETYEKMEKLFEAYRQKELRDMVEATDRNKEDPLDPDNGDIDSRGNNTDASSLDSNANLPTSGQSSETGSRRSSFHKTSDTESIDKAIGFKDRRKIPGISSKGGGSRIPTSHIPSLSCRIPTPKSKISSRSGISGGIPKSSFSYQKNGVKSYRNYDDDDDDDDNDDNNSASATSDNHEFITIEPISDASRRTSYSDESIISTSDASVNNIGLRPEAQVPRVAQPLTTGRQRLISSRRNDIESRAEKTKLVRPLEERSARDTNSSEQKLFHDEDEETY